MAIFFSYHADSSPLAQYAAIRTVVFVVTLISLTCAVMTTLVYLYLWCSNHQHAERLTLQFVMVASVASIVVEIFDIINWTMLGNSTYCGGARTVILFFNCINASALSCIGLNLVIILYSGIPKQRIIKPFYYPGIVVLSLIATSVPIYQASHWYYRGRQPESERSCWYYSRHFDGTGESNFFWLWYYCFIFVIITISAALSMAAMWKLYSLYHSEKLSSKQTQGQSNHVFCKVGVRCILYSLVPFITNIWSFIVQFIELCPDHYSYPVSCLDAILSSSDGLFVSAIFFSEPTVTTFILEKWHTWTNRTRRHDQEEPPHLLQELSSSTVVEAI